MSNLPAPLRGIITPMVTPLLGRDLLDRMACERLVERLIAARVTGIFVLGTTGEAPGLSYRLRREIVDCVCRAVNGRVPVLVSVTDTAIIETLDLARFAADAGASALVLAPPYYFRLNQPELLGYLQRLTPELPSPVYLYNIPSHTKTHFAPATVKAAAELPNIYGIKDSSGDMEYFSELVSALAHRPDFTILCGPEELLLESIARGGHGGIAGGSNLFPEFYVALYRAAAAGGMRRTAELQAIVMEISDTIYHTAPDDSGYLRGMKCALSHLGRCANVMAEPYTPFGPEESAAVARAVKKIEDRVKEFS